MIPLNEQFILLVPDLKFWVTGRIARAIQETLSQKNIKSLICSGVILDEFIKKYPIIRELVTIVHFLTPHLATRYGKLFYSDTVLVSTIHHIENEASEEPIGYSDAIMTVSNQWHNELIKKGISKYKLFMIQNGIDCSLFKPVEPNKKSKLRKKFGLIQNSFIIGFSAKKTSDSCDRKGIDVLEKLINHNSIYNHNQFLWFIRGPGWNDLVKILKDCGKNVHYEPFLITDKELSESYQVLDAFIITSRIEGGPVPLLEAMASGLPVITTKVGAAIDIVNDGENAFWVDFNSHEQILNKLKKLYTNKILGQNVGRNARKTILDNLQWSNTTKNVIQLYKAAIDNFMRRQNQITVSRFGIQKNQTNTKLLEKWIYINEATYFARFLYNQGAFMPAGKYANKAIISDFLNVQTIKKNLKFSSPYMTIRTIFSSNKRCF